MSFYHASQHEALNQNLAELDGQIKFHLNFFPLVLKRWKIPFGNLLRV